MKRKYGRSKRSRRSRLRRRTFKRYSRRRSRGARASTRSMGFLIPDRLRVKLRFRDRVVLTSTSGIITSKGWVGNGAYDPDTALGGASMIGFSKYMALYGNNIVHGSSMVIKLCNTGTSSGAQTIEYALNVNPQGGLATTMEEVIGQPYNVNGLYQFGSGLPVRKMYMSTAKIFGLSKAAITSNPNFWGSATNNPTNAFYWILYSQSADRSTTTIGLFYVTLTMYITFFNRSNQ